MPYFPAIGFSCITNANDGILCFNQTAFTPILLSSYLNKKSNQNKYIMRWLCFLTYEKINTKFKLDTLKLIQHKFQMSLTEMNTAVSKEKTLK